MAPINDPSGPSPEAVRTVLDSFEQQQRQAQQAPNAGLDGGWFDVVGEGLNLAFNVDGLIESVGEVAAGAIGNVAAAAGGSIAEAAGMAGEALGNLSGEAIGAMAGEALSGAAGAAGEAIAGLAGGLFEGLLGG